MTRRIVRSEAAAEDLLGIADDVATVLASMPP